ncbi:hypothetical protein BDV09DRAFT_177169 [Aspergillus tetrazonus]
MTLPIKSALVWWTVLANSLGLILVKGNIEKLLVPQLLADLHQHAAPFVDKGSSSLSILHPALQKRR